MSKDNLIATILIIFIVLIVAVAFVRGQATLIDKRSYCEQVYGEDYRFEYEKIFEEQQCVKYSKENLKIIDRQTFTFEELLDYCEKPDFFDFTKWETKCQ